MTGAPGTQGLGAGGVFGSDSGTLARTRHCGRAPANGPQYGRQEGSWALPPREQTSVPGTGWLVARIHFPFKGYRLDTNDRTALNLLVKGIQTLAGKSGQSVMLLIIGHADHRGSKRYNLKLGARRALSVTRYIRRKAGGAVIAVYARTLGEARAEQPNGCFVPEKSMEADRRTDVFQTKVTMLRPSDETVKIPKVDDVIDDAVRIIKDRKARYPNRAERLLCMLAKLKEPATTRNDGYWSYGDWKACAKYAYVNGKFSFIGIRKAAEELRKRRKSARRFLLESVATRTGDDARFDQLRLLDTTIFNSWQKVADRLAASGSEKFWPYWATIKNEIVKMWKDKRTLYSCIKARKRSIWGYVPV